MRRKISYAKIVTFVPFPGAIQYFKNHKCTMLAKVDIFQGTLPRMKLIQILKSTILSISQELPTRI